MKLNVKALSLAAGLLWGGIILFVEICTTIWPGYGIAFLEMASSIYPGYTPAAGGSSIAIGSLYGFVDGGIGGLIFAWLYNLLAK